VLTQSLEGEFGISAVLGLEARLKFRLVYGLWSFQNGWLGVDGVEWLLSVSDPETYGRVGPSAVCKEELLAASGPEALAAMCTNCLRPTDKCAHGELVNQVPHVGMRYRNATGVRQVELVTTTTRSTSSGEPIYDVRVRRSRDGRLSTKHYPTNYRDYYRYHCET